VVLPNYPVAVALLVVFAVLAAACRDHFDPGPSKPTMKTSMNLLMLLANQMMLRMLKLVLSLAL
jgi:hypothetical protein